MHLPPQSFIFLQLFMTPGWERFSPIFSSLKSSRLGLAVVLRVAALRVLHIDVAVTVVVDAVTAFGLGRHGGLAWLWGEGGCGQGRGRWGIGWARQQGVGVRP